MCHRLTGLVTRAHDVLRKPLTVSNSQQELRRNHAAQYSIESGLKFTLEIMLGVTVPRSASDRSI
jgi:hypothetical protein